MKFLNGFKTILGVAGVVGSTILAALGKDAGLVPGVVEAVSGLADQTYGLVVGAAGVLTALGIIHKREKAKEADEK